jgi:hypothetical protein
MGALRLNEAYKKKEKFSSNEKMKTTCLERKEHSQIGGYPVVKSTTWEIGRPSLFAYGRQSSRQSSRRIGEEVGRRIGEREREKKQASLQPAACRE